jgi:hypothetical protein
MGRDIAFFLEMHEVLGHFGASRHRKKQPLINTDDNRGWLR